MKRLQHSIAVFALVFLLSTPAIASDARPLGTHGSWTAYTFTEDGNKVCYMAAQPIKDEGTYSKRDPIYALITHRPAEGAKDVFSYITGYTYKPGSDATVKVNGEKFVLFTQDGTAWAADSETDAKISKAIRAGSDMVVEGVSSRGTQTKDTYSLKGSGAAYEQITKECGG